MMIDGYVADLIAQDVMRDASNDERAAVDKYISSISSSGWVAVEHDGLPSRSGEYWITVRSKDGELSTEMRVFSALQGKFAAQEYYDHNGYEVLAWQPVKAPLPYRPKSI